MMKKIIFSFLVLALCLSCSKDDNRKDNPYLFDLNFSVVVDLSLPQYNGLNFPSNPVYIGNYGHGGIIIMNTGSNYVAFDAADPNHVPKNCSTLEIDGLEGTCQCEDHNKYNLITGQFVEGENLEYTLYAYRVTDNGNGTLTVSN